MTPSVAVAVLWVGWGLSWMLASFWSRRALARPAIGEILLYIVPTLAGAWLLFYGANDGLAVRRLPPLYQLWRLPNWARWLVVGIEAAGFAFTWWARITLGDLWSSQVSRKEDHHIIETGPYGLVRHPIYTGLIVAAFATAVEVGSAQALVGAALMSFGFWMKARLEERFLMAELGESAYAGYRRRIPMLAPFWPTRR
jgi:protein-S-isoprenylcysteine O-methyltransferase Ste14